jgi:hypothetical protein
MAPRIPVWLLFFLLLIPTPTFAQWGRRFAIAAGPAIAVEDTPPNAGVHFRTSAAFSPGPRTVNLLADAYVTWLAPATEVETFPGLGPVSSREQETQIGVGLSALFSFLREGSVSPYFLAGAVYRWSDASSRVEVDDGTGQITTFRSSLNEDQFDILLGLGAAFRWGTRRVLLEARAYGGTTIYLPITLGLTL